MNVIKYLKMMAISLVISINWIEVSVAQNLITSERWVYLADTVMGGVSEGSANIIDTPEGQAINLFGKVSTQNNGGFIQARTRVNFKANQYKGIRIKIRGNENEYYIHLRTPRTMPWNYFSAKFYATEDWQIIDLPLSAFSYSRNPNKGLDSSRIRALGIVAYGKDFDARLDIANIEFY